MPFFARVRTTLVNAVKACAPLPFFEPCETLRTITAGCSTLSARLCGRRYLWVYQEAQQGPPVVMPAQLIEQPLSVRIFQPPVAPLVREPLLQGLGCGQNVWHRCCPG